MPPMASAPSLNSCGYRRKSLVIRRAAGAPGDDRVFGSLTAVANGQLPSMTVALVGAFVLGIVHGVTPGEHTWPITFSYAL